MERARKQKPRVVILSVTHDPFISGAERFVIETGKRLASDYELFVVTARMERRLPKTEAKDGMTVVRVGFGIAPFLDKYLFPLFGAWKALRLRADVVHAVMESFAGGALVVYRLMRPRTPSLLTLQSGSIDSERIVNKFPSFLLRWIHVAPRRIQAISSALADRARRFGARAVEVVPNGVDTAPFLAARGTTKRSGLVLSIGRLHEDKGFDVLVRAFASVVKERPDACLEIGGEGPERQKLETMIRERGLEKSVFLLGNVPYGDMPKRMAEAEVFALPSRAEGMGNVFVEAQAAGTAVVGSRIGGIPDIVQDGATGLLVPPESPEALSAAVLRLLASSEERSRFASAASGRLARYEWDRIAESVGKAYAELSSGLNVLLCTGIYAPEIGGPASYVRALAQGLQRRGHSLEIVTYGDEKTKADEPWKMHVVARGASVLGRYARYAWRVFRLASSFDVVYLQDPVSEGLPGTVASLLSRRKTVMKVVGDYAWEMSQQAKGEMGELLDVFVSRRHAGRIGMLEKIERWTASRAERVIVPSRYLKAIVEKWGVPSGRIGVVVTNILPLPETAPREELRKKFGLADDARAILSVMRCVPWKRGDFLIEALSRLPEHFVFVLGGDGPELEKWKRLAAERGVASRCRFLGRVDRATLAEWYRAADLFALPSTYEGFPHVVVEAVTTGLPCVVTNKAGNPETKDLFPEHVTVLPYDDAEEWASYFRAGHPRLAPAKNRSFEEVVDETTAVLKDVCAS